MPALQPLADFLDQTLDVANIPDYSGAMNGVQLENVGDIERIATAVDFSTASIEGAINIGARLLIVHHGMFWGGAQPITGYRHRRLWTLMTHDVAVYSAHLPLDVHPEVGNNALLAKRIGLQPSGRFLKYQTLDIGLSGECDLPTWTIAERAGDLAAEFRGTLVT